MKATRFDMELLFTAGKVPSHWLLDFFKTALSVTKAKPKTKQSHLKHMKNT